MYSSIVNIQNVDINYKYTEFYYESNTHIPNLFLYTIISLYRLEVHYTSVTKSKHRIKIKKNLQNIHGDQQRNLYNSHLQGYQRIQLQSFRQPNFKRLTKNKEMQKMNF